MLSASKSTLLEQKKEQWAREREEMSQLYLPWGTGERYSNRLQIRNQFASTLDLHHQYQCQDPPPRQRSPSLPPIHQLDKEERRSKEAFNRNINSGKRFSFYDEDCEGDTSGYGSETVNHIRKQSGSFPNPVIAWQNHADDNRTAPPSGPRSMDDAWSSRSPRIGTAEEGRPKWGDRGVATGRLWEPTTPNARLPQMQNQKKGTPSWVERGLNMIDNPADVLVIDQRSTTHSGFECDRSSYNGSDEGRTFLRGQNVPIEPEIRAQRENQRIKALELQSAILSQLEDREKRKQEERERKLNEERMEELRLQRQQEEENMRLEEEKRKNEEKQLLEQKKLETLKKALEDAEKNARLEKEKRFINYRNQNLINETEKELKSKDDNSSDKDNDIQPNEITSPAKSHRTYDIGSARSQQLKKEEKPSEQTTEYNSHRTTEFNSPRSVSYGNVNVLLNGSSPLSRVDSQYSILPIGINGEQINGQQNCIQLAVLVPQHLNNSMFSVSLNSLNQSAETERTLTPRKYRMAKHKDVSTQTDDSQISKDNGQKNRNIDKDYSNIDENAPQESSLKKDRRLRSEERYKKDLENRPKWGVNRPAAQYKKQSEKDPFYSQKRKMRYKYRTLPSRQYISQSSDDSRSPSPPTRSEKTEKSSKYRNSLSQSYWRTKRPSQSDFTPISLTEQSVNVQTDITCDDYDNKTKMSPSKRLTLSQKFINDKYGNRKLWSDDEKQTKNNIFDTDNRKKLIDQMNKAKKDYLDRNDD